MLYYRSFYAILLYHFSISFNCKHTGLFDISSGH